MKNISVKKIGGFFPLEIGTSHTHYHTNALALTSGRACLKYILMQIKPTKVFVPYYICNAALLPIKELNIEFEFYSLNERLQPRQTVTLSNNDYFLYVNYFGLHDRTIDYLYALYGNRLLIDNTQAFFSLQYQQCYSFNSARKFFGVPDGGFLYQPNPQALHVNRNNHLYYQHLIERLLDKDTAYQHYLASEANISAEVTKISFLTERLLANIDYQEVIKRRKENFEFYRHAFTDINMMLDLPKLDDAVPFCYPLLLKDTLNREAIFAKQIFLPRFWQEILNRNLQGDEFEKMLSQKLLPLPVDHRYDLVDCQRVVEVIFSVLNDVMPAHASMTVNSIR